MTTAIQQLVAGLPHVRRPGLRDLARVILDREIPGIDKRQPPSCRYHANNRGRVVCSSLRRLASRGLEPRAAAVGGRIEDEATVELDAALGSEPRLAGLATGHEIAELRGGQPASGGLEPDDEPAAVSPSRAAPAARAGDEPAAAAARAGQLGDRGRWAWWTRGTCRVAGRDRLPWLVGSVLGLACRARIPPLARGAVSASLARAARSGWPRTGGRAGSSLSGAGPGGSGRRTSAVGVAELEAQLVVVVEHEHRGELLARLRVEAAQHLTLPPLEQHAGEGRRDRTAGDATWHREPAAAGARELARACGHSGAAARTATDRRRVLAGGRRGRAGSADRVDRARRRSARCRP